MPDPMTDNEQVGVGAWASDYREQCSILERLIAAQGDLISAQQDQIDRLLAENKRHVTQLECVRQYARHSASDGAEDYRLLEILKS